MECRHAANTLKRFIYVEKWMDFFKICWLCIQSLVGFFPEFQGLQTNIVHKNGICPSSAFSVSRNIAVMKRGISVYLYTQERKPCFLGFASESNYVVFHGKEIKSFSKIWVTCDNNKTWEQHELLLRDVLEKPRVPPPIHGIRRFRKCSRRPRQMETGEK